MSSSAIETGHHAGTCTRPCRFAVIAIIAVCVGAMITPTPSRAQQAAALSADASDPIKLGWMIGSPPPDDKIIRFSDSDYFSFPKLRWTVCHFRQLMPTVRVSRGLGAPVPLERKIDTAIDAVTFTPLGGNKPMTWATRSPPTTPMASSFFITGPWFTNATPAVSMMPDSMARCP